MEKSNDGNLLKTDLCIIGAGSAGLSVAAAASQMGAEVILIENRSMGGECLNYGCVPSKALIAAGKCARTIHNASTFGINVDTVKVDYAKVRNHLHHVIAAIAPHDSIERFTSLGVKVIKGSPKFLNPKKLQINDQTVSAKYFVIATGSAPAIPPIPGIDTVDYLTNETLFSLDKQPEHLIIIGGGPIGCEMASAQSLLGTRVSLVQRSHIMGKDDQELVAILRQQLQSDGVVLYENLSIEQIAKHDSGVAVTIKQNDETQTIYGSHLLIATGRKPNVNDIDLEAAKVKYDKKGIQVDKRMRTNQKHIFAIGDVTAGNPRFTHVANLHAGIVIRNTLFHLPAKVDYRVLPWVTYTEPELAHVGLTEEEARKKYSKIKVLKQEFTTNDRAQTERDTVGMIKVVTKNSGEILGASILGHEANGLINIWSLAMTKKLKIKDIAQLLIPYPTRSEISKQVAGSFFTETLYSTKMRKIVRFLLHGF